MNQDRAANPSTFVIAEAGVNHNGSLDLAKRLIDVAVEAGADAVKFQTYRTEELVTQTAEQAAYQADNTGVRESQYAMLKRLELSESDHAQLWAHCQQQSIEFMSTAFDSSSIEFLHQLGVKRWKIPSGELQSVPYLRQIARLNQPTILSTGMSRLAEVEHAVQTLLQAGLVKNRLTVLHATSAYPTPFDEVNLRAMPTLANRFDVAVGLSDHSSGIEVPIAAVAMGAQVIEKHFTLDKSLPGPDHKASLEPAELKAMIQAIRHVESALGDGKKRPSLSESGNRAVVRKRIVAAVDIQAGERLTETNITLKRSDHGLEAKYWDALIGRSAIRNLVTNDSIQRGDYA